MILKSGQDGLQAVDLLGAVWMFSPLGEVGGWAGTEAFGIPLFSTEPLRWFYPQTHSPRAPRLPSVPPLHLLASPPTAWCSPAYPCLSLAPGSLGFRPLCSAS